MRQITNLRTYRDEELLDVLAECAHQLNLAYQETLNTEWLDTSYSASLACTFLRCHIEMNNKSYMIH